MLEVYEKIYRFPLRLQLISQPYDAPDVWVWRPEPLLMV